MIRFLFVILHLFICHGLLGQLKENFDDGNFSTDPAWTGTPGSWVVNTAGELQSNNASANTSFYLSTPCKVSLMTEWNIDLRLNYNTSSSNYVDLFIMASSGDLLLNGNYGYFVRIGNTQDEVSLYRKDPGGQLVKLIDGTDGITNKSDNSLSIKVTKSNDYTFTLYRDTSGTGTQMIPEGSVIDSSFKTSEYFGIVVRQSTSAFFQKHFFDNIIIGSYVPDILPPSIVSVIATSQSLVDIEFNEPLDGHTAEDALNYSVDHAIGHPATAILDPQHPSIVHLKFNKDFPNGTDVMLVIHGVRDLNNNSITSLQSSFSFYAAQRFDIIIDEVMTDPSPRVSLPDAEFIELKNLSGRDLKLGGWKLVTSSSSSVLSDYIFPADSFLILTSSSSVNQFAPYGKAIALTSFPSLDNDGTLLSLVSKEGRNIHAIAYESSWYDNPAKKDGGWSLEMIDVNNPCSGINNWKTSTDNKGGTPGKKNAVDATNPDESPPVLLRTYALDSITLAIVFDEPLDSTAASNGEFSLSASGMAIAAFPQSPLFTEVILKLPSALTKRNVETITVQHVSDCKGNAIGIHHIAKAGLDEAVQARDIVVNEILFNPRPGAFDYVELYNRSRKIIDASALYIGNRTGGGQIASLKKISVARRMIFPGEYMVLTEDAGSLKKEYLVKDPATIAIVNAFPSYPDDEGNVVLCDTQGNVIDEVGYDEQWHFALISNTEGIAIERLDPDETSNNPGNWHSAASTAGFGTPGYQNSQYLQMGGGNANVTVGQKIFSPDNDGFDDVVSVNYHVEEPGYVANITVFDAAGRPVRWLVKNDLMGLNGSWQWDGLGEKKQQLPIGMYIIDTEIFNLKGKTKRFRNTIVLARKLF